MKNTSIRSRILFLPALLILFGMAQKSVAQDFQLSQWDAAPVAFSPAQTGMLKFTDLRVAALYRSQWSSLATSFNTFGLSFDMALDDRWGGGIVFMNEDAANIINTSNFLVSTAYQITDPNNTKYMLSAGVQLGFLYKRVNTNELIFDSQFDGFNFDNSLPTFEQFDRVSRMMLDANIGLSYRSTDRTKKINPFADFAVFNITTPNESFIGSQASKLPMRWMASAGARMEITRGLVLDPSVIWMRQREAQQFQITALGHYEVSGTPYQVIGGLGYRTEDAVIIHAGLRHNANIFRISYDVNVSGLSAYSNNRGAIEFTAIYRPGRRTTRAIY
jgi:type IX secretion system PorP/SprF family membrane protein